MRGARRILSLLLLVGAGLGATVVLPGAAANATGAAAATATLAPVADAYVDSKSPSTNFGDDPELWVDAPPNENSGARTANSYLRFEVEGLTEPVEQATLRLYAIRGDDSGFDVSGLGGVAWDETTITWDNAPQASGAVVASSGPFAAGEFVSLDVTPLVVANGSVTFELTTSGRSRIALASREQGGDLAPRLVVQTAPPAPPAAEAPSNLTPPSVAGTPREGETLVASPGTWSGTEPISYALQWQRCDSGGGACADVTGATGSSYLLGGGDVGATLRVRVTATNEAGSATAASPATPVVAAAAQVDVTAPSAPGSLAVTAASASSVSLSWAASSDDVAVAGYEVLVDGTLVDSTTGTSYVFSGLSCGTSHTFGVRAFDAAGNRSATSTLTSATAECASAAKPCGTAASGPATYDHVVWIVFENKPYSSIIGSSAAPYLNGLAARCGLATNFHAITHPSLPNYLAMTGGSTFGVTDDAGPAAHPIAGASIFGQTGGGSFAESMPSNCYLADAGSYRVHHNPQTYYTGEVAQCAVSNTPAFAWRKFELVVPNNCDNMHDCSVGTGDAWLEGFLEPLLASPTYTAGRTAIFVTWDEDDGSQGNHVVTLVLSPSTPVGARSSAAFDHYSLLRTTEELLGIGTFLGNANTAASMRSAFGL